MDIKSLEERVVSLEQRILELEKELIQYRHNWFIIETPPYYSPLYHQTWTSDSTMYVTDNTQETK